jgi:hypothetical protein
MFRAGPRRTKQFPKSGGRREGLASGVRHRRQGSTASLSPGWHRSWPAGPAASRRRRAVACPARRSNQPPAPCAAHPRPLRPRTPAPSGPGPARPGGRPRTPAPQRTSQAGGNCSPPRDDVERAASFPRRGRSARGLARTAPASRSRPRPQGNQPTTIDTIYKLLYNSCSFTTCISDQSESLAMPRTSALNEIKRHEICALLACGASRRQAAEYVGCAITTIANTARRDPDFAERLIAAECNYALRNLRAINRAASRSWRAAVWALREHDPGEFGANRESSVPPASIARAAAREVAVGVPASAGSPDPYAATVVGHKPPVRGSTPMPRSDQPSMQPTVSILERAEQARRLTGCAAPAATVVGHNPPCSFKTTLLRAAALIAGLLLGINQPLSALRDNAPPDGHAAPSAVHSQPAAVQHPIVGHNPPSVSADRRPIVGHQSLPHAAGPNDNPSAAALEISLFTANRPVTLRLPWWKRLHGPAP